MRYLTSLFVLLTLSLTAVLGQPHPWAGLRVGILGDSMSDPANSATDYYYYTYLSDSVGIVPRVYARSGRQWHQVARAAADMVRLEGDSLDAVIIFAGTNDYFHDCPIGRFYTEHDTVVDVNGQMVARRHRHFVMADTTFCGRLNQTLSLLRHHYPLQQIVIMTPIHRAYANFSDPGRGKYNVQPDENVCNGLGLYIEDYVAVIRRAGELWSVPVVDAFAMSGLYPLDEAYSDQFGDAATDLLHPNARGHVRLGRLLEAQLRAIPPTFR